MKKRNGRRHHHRLFVIYKTATHRRVLFLIAITCVSCLVVRARCRRRPSTARSASSKKTFQSTWKDTALQIFSPREITVDQTLSRSPHKPRRWKERYLRSQSGHCGCQQIPVLRLSKRKAHQLVQDNGTSCN